MIFQEGYKQARLNVESFLNCKAVILDWSVYLSWCIYSVWLRESCSMKGTLFCMLLVNLVGKLSTLRPQKMQHEGSIVLYSVGGPQ